MKENITELIIFEKIRNISKWIGFGVPFPLLNIKSWSQRREIGVIFVGSDEKIVENSNGTFNNGWNLNK